MVSQKIVSSVKTGVQGFHNYLKLLDSGLRRNDKFEAFSTFYETIKYHIFYFGI